MSRKALKVLAVCTAVIAVAAAYVVPHLTVEEGPKGGGLGSMNWVVVGDAEAPLLAMLVVEPSCVPCRQAMDLVEADVASGRGHLLVSVVGKSEAAELLVGLGADGVANWYGFSDIDSGKTIEKDDLKAAREALRVNNAAFAAAQMPGTPVIVVPPASPGASSALFVGAGHPQWLDLARANAAARGSKG